MSTAMHHYMMDCYYPDATKADGARRETNQIKAIDDALAISEAKMAGSWKKLIWFEVRKESKKGSQVIYSSKTKS